MPRAGDLEKSPDFYTRIMGMKPLRGRDYPERAFTLTFVGYADESETAVLELRYDRGTKRYDPDNAGGITVTAFVEDPDGCKIELPADDR